MGQKQKVKRLVLVGASGAVGTEVMRLLEERQFPLEELRLLASKRSAGKSLEYKGREIELEVLGPESFKDCTLAIFTAGAERSREYAPLAAEQGALVVDNSSAFRMQADVPLVVPEVNPQALDVRPACGIIANPNCSTIQLVVALWPLHQRAGLKRVVVSTYQSVSGAGRKAMAELSAQVTALFSCQEVKMEAFPHRIAFNCIPHIDTFLSEGDTREERKMVDETRKIMGLPDLGLSVTAVRVPVFIGHSEAVNLELERPLDPDEARALLQSAAGVEVTDDPKQNIYPLACDAATRDEVFVGRIRRDTSLPHGLNLWLVADNLRKGAALNALQIAELCLERGIL